ncbi:MAG: IS4 family transposase [Candidatus Riflemargulisbacteria bacterium]
MVSYSRLLANSKVTWQAVHKEYSKDINSKVDCKHVLVINDTTEINFEKHRNYLSEKDKELGPVGNNIDIGFFCHPGIVIDTINKVALGFSYLKLWNRSWEKQSCKKRDYKNQVIEEKESYRWIDCALESKKALTNAAHVTIVADRESDIYEEFCMIPDQNTDILIRCRGDRRLFDIDKSLYETILAEIIKDTYRITIRKTGKRKERKTELEIKFGKVKLRKPKSRNIASSIPEGVEMNWVEAKEKPQYVPDREEAIHWILLTSHSVTCNEDAFQIIRWYKLRWQIELLFSTLKSGGLNLEASEIEKGKALKTLCALSLQAALKINQLRQFRDDTTGISAEAIFTKKEIVVIEVLTSKYEGATVKQRNPYKKKTIAWAAWTVARLGGWKGYSCESPPGNKTFKWGLDRFNAIYQGFELKEKMCV